METVSASASFRAASIWLYLVVFLQAAFLQAAEMYRCYFPLVSLVFGGEFREGGAEVVPLLLRPHFVPLLLSSSSWRPLESSTHSLGATLLSVVWFVLGMAILLVCPQISYGVHTTPYPFAALFEGFTVYFSTSLEV